LDLNSLEIGGYQEGDIAEIMTIERDCFPAPWSEALFRNELVSPLSRILIGRTDHGQSKCVAGYTVYWRVADEIHLHNIAVRRDLQRQGIASRLLNEVMRRSQLEGARWMTLEVRQRNLPAQMMYLKFGFSVKGARPGYYTDTHEDALIMWVGLPLISQKRHAETPTNVESDEE
jgi:[ribosomal protein S18]-alanine N-acetyltransferase